MKVRARDIEAMDMARDDGQKEETAVEHAVPFEPTQHRYCQRREEDVDACEEDSIREGSHDHCRCS